MAAVPPVARVEAERPEECWLEQLVAEPPRKQGARALDHLRDGVEEAIKALGRGFLAHPANQALRDRLRTAAWPAKTTTANSATRLPAAVPVRGRGSGRAARSQAEPDARKRYTRFYSTARLPPRWPSVSVAPAMRTCTAACAWSWTKLGRQPAAPTWPARPGQLPLVELRPLPDLESAEIANHDFSTPSAPWHGPIEAPVAGR